MGNRINCCVTAGEKCGQEVLYEDPAVIRPVFHAEYAENSLQADGFPSESFLTARTQLAGARWDDDDEDQCNDYKKAFENNLDWLSWVVLQVWPFAHEAVKKIIKQDIEPALKEAVPFPLKGIQFMRISLGDRPPKFGSVRLKRDKHIADRRPRGVDISNDADNKKTNDRGHGKVEIEFDVEWVCDADIDIDCTMGLHIGVKSFSLRGPVSLILTPVMDSMPVVAGLRLFMFSPPVIDWDFTGIADIADHPMVASTIREVVQQKISDVMVLPNQYFWHWVWGREQEIDVASQQYVLPIAMLRVGVVEARGLTALDWALFGKATSDPYALVRLGTQSSRTAVMKKTLNPKWGDSAFVDFLVYHRRELLYVNVFDKDLVTADDLIGKIEPIPLAKLLKANNAWWPIYQRKDGRTEGHGEVRIVVDVYDIGSSPTCFSNPLKPRGSADSVGLLTVQLRCLCGLKKADSGGVVVRVIAGGRSVVSKASEIVDPAIHNAEWIDPGLIQSVRFLSQEGYSIERIAEASGLTEKQIKKVLGEKGEIPFHAHWQQNLHLLIKSHEELLEIEVDVPIDSSDAVSTFRLCEPLYPKDVLACGQCCMESKLALEPKPEPKSGRAKGVFSGTLAAMKTLSQRSSPEKKAAPESRKLVLDARLNLSGFEGC